MSEIEQATPEAARRLTDQIKTVVGVAWELIVEAYDSRAWAALGYGSWNEYCDSEFGTAQLRIPREDRREVVASLREAGLSTRAIAAATGLSKNTVRSDLGQVGQFDPPAESHQEPPGVTYDESGYQATESAPPTAPPAPPSPPPARTPPPVITGADGRRYPASRPAPVSPLRPVPSAATDDGEVIDGEVVSGDDLFTDDLLDAIERRQPGSRAQVDRARVRARWSRAVGGLADLPLQDAEQVSAVISEAEIAVAEATLANAAQWFKTLRAARSGLRVVGGSR